MKAFVLFHSVVFIIANSAILRAAPAEGCAQVVQKLNNVAAIISRNADAYWEHRGRFSELKYGSSRLSVPNAEQLAEQEKSDAGPFKTAMPTIFANFSALVAQAESRNCFSPVELHAIREATFGAAKRVNFDQFPLELPIEGNGTQNVPPRMPMN